MGVYIKGMELPNEGVEWICFVRFTNRAAEFYDPTGESESVFYDAVEVPEHGRLVDADKLEETMDDRYSLGEIGRRERDDVVNALRYNAPTVIPREEEAEVSYQRKCKHFSLEYVGNPGAVPACNRDAILEVFDCSNCADNPDNKKMTNADRIRAMNDEELADFLHELTNWGCPENGARNCVERCGDCWLTWLREDVKE